MNGWRQRNQWRHSPEQLILTENVLINLCHVFCLICMIVWHLFESEWLVLFDMAASCISFPIAIWPFLLLEYPPNLWLRGDIHYAYITWVWWLLSFFLYSIQRAKPLSFVYNYKRFGGSYDYCDVECWLNTSNSNFSFIVAQNKPDFSEVLSNGVGVLCWGIYVTMVVYVILYLCFNLSPGRWPRPSRQSLPITERWLL